MPPRDEVKNASASPSPSEMDDLGSGDGLPLGVTIAELNDRGSAHNARGCQAPSLSHDAFSRFADSTARKMRIYETALSSSLDLVYVFDLQGRFTFANPGLLTVLGKSADEVQGKDFFDLEYPSALAARLARQIGEVIRTRRPLRDETPYDGTAGTRMYEYIFTPVFDETGAVEAVAGVTRDITERIVAERSLLASERQLQAAIAATNLGLWTMNPATGIVSLSPYSQAMHGMPAETLATTEAWAVCLHPDDLEPTMAAFAGSIDPAVRETCFRRYRVMNSQGTVRHIECAWQVEFEHGGPDAPCSYVAGTHLDVTERVADRKALEEQAEALREASRRKDEFLAMLAHELRNPLSSVRNAVTVLMEPGDGSQQTWATDVINRQARQLSRLVDDLLDVSRITHGKIELQREFLDAARCLESACEAVAPLMAERHHLLHATIPRGELWVRGDPTRLEQIVVNLLANAARYTKPHGHVWLDARRRGEEILVEVRDNGIGIPPDKIPLMFELFAQGERSPGRSEGGLGIGLTIVRGLCELHGGSISASSAGPGLGSSFVVRLPATERVAVPVGPAAAPAPQDEGAGRQILVVDDNVDAAHGLGRLLTRRGYTVRLAGTGEEALSAVSTIVPAAVLLDLGLPGMDGFEVATRLRQEPRCAGLLIMAISGYGQEADREHTRKAGFDHHLTKPVDFEEVRALLREKLA